MTDAAGKTALVVGASRGLGLGLARELVKRGWRVTATVRGAAAGLETVTVRTLDINDKAGGASLAKALAGEVFDLVFISAGIAGPPAGEVEGAREADVAQLFMTNVVSPVRLAQHLLPLLRPKTGVLAFMSSLLGSIESNTNSQPWLYSASKAALNQLTRGFVAALPKDNTVTVVSMHPGWVRTDMGGENAPLDLATSVTGMVDVLERQAGAGGHKFLDYQGKAIPW